jgi:CheY-like chemotaxis protein
MEALRLLRSSMPATIEICQNIEDGSGQVSANPTQIHQMIMNLGINAYHAMREKGGVLEVTLRQKKIGAENRSKYPGMAIGSYMELIVSDTGHGIDRSLMKRIFDPYFTTKKIGNGTGLGLSLVHSIVKDHNGHITVESESGKGTAFHIFLPRIISTQLMPESASNGILPGGKEHILVVDDEPLLLQMMKQMLEGLGYTVTAQSNSIDALTKLGNHPEMYDIVITDMTMPHMTGNKLAQRLLEIKPEIPVVLCSGFSETITENEARPRNIRAFLTKPLTTAQIASTIRGILDREQVPFSGNIYTLTV